MTNLATHFSVLHLLLVANVMPSACRAGANYSVIHALFEEKLGSANYNPEIRPVREHTTVTNVTLHYGLYTIVEIDDVSQTMTTSGKFQFLWEDEKVTWNPLDYDQLLYFQPQPKQIWRPRMVVMNSPDGQDPFKDDVASTYAIYSGQVSWRPGAILKTSCQLKIEKYPFDVQICTIQMCPMSHFSDSIRLHKGEDEAMTSFYVPNGAWNLLSTQIDIIDVSVSEYYYMSCAQIQLEVQRRPNFSLVNIILPVVLLSFLNIFVFAIPVDSGEKISYGITVLLALALFLSLISSMMPQASDAVPAVTIYLFCLLVGSVLSVLVSIFIVLLHHKDMKEENLLKVKANFKHTVTTFTNVQKAIQPVNGQEDDVYIPSPPILADENRSENKKNRYRASSKRIDTISFIVFFFLWSTATMCFFIYVKT